MMKINKNLLSLLTLTTGIVTNYYTNVDALNLMPPNISGPVRGISGPGRSTGLMKEWRKTDNELGDLLMTKRKQKDKKAQPGGVVLHKANESDAPNPLVGENNTDANIVLSGKTAHNYNTDALSNSENKLATKWRDQDKYLEDRLARSPSRKLKKKVTVDKGIQLEVAKDLDHANDVKKTSLENQSQNAEESQPGKISPENNVVNVAQELMSVNLARGLRKVLTTTKSRKNNNNLDDGDAAATARRFRRRLIKGQSPKRSTFLKAEENSSGNHIKSTQENPSGKSKDEEAKAIDEVNIDQGCRGSDDSSKLMSNNLNFRTLVDVKKLLLQKALECIDRDIEKSCNQRDGHRLKHNSPNYRQFLHPTAKQYAALRNCNDRILENQFDPEDSDMSRTPAESSELTDFDLHLGKASPQKSSASSYSLGSSIDSVQVQEDSEEPTPSSSSSTNLPESEDNVISTEEHNNSDDATARLIESESFFTRVKKQLGNFIYAVTLANTVHT